jgi:hypothetical protein
MQLAANVTSGDPVDWQSINWKQVYQTVKNLRQRLFRASREGDLKRVRSLQRLMLRCQANVLESVRRVTQVNRGKDTPGVDQVIVTTPEERGQLCHRLSQLDLHQAHPVRRVYIPKRKGRRPLGIPMAHAYCISLLRRLGIAVATPTSMNSVYQITQYSGLGLTNQVGACKKPSSKIAERFQLFRFFTSTRIRDRWRAIIS